MWLITAFTIHEKLRLTAVRAETLSNEKLSVDKASGGNNCCLSNVCGPGLHSKLWGGFRWIRTQVATSNARG